MRCACGVAGTADRGLPYYLYICIERERERGGYWQPIATPPSARESSEFRDRTYPSYSRGNSASRRCIGAADMASGMAGGMVDRGMVSKCVSKVLRPLWLPMSLSSINECSFGSSPDAAESISNRAVQERPCHKLPLTKIGS